MPFRYKRLWIAVGIATALWTISALRDTDSQFWIRPVGIRPGPVRILQFYASAGAVKPGEKAQLCYGVINARSVTITPSVEGVYPSIRHCLEVVPEHTTHYMIMAEGYDGAVATKSFTLPVRSLSTGPRVQVNYAEL